MRNLLAAAVGTAAGQGLGSAPVALAQTPALITSTFFQPDNTVFGGWSEGDWDNYFKQYKALGFERVFTQWTSSNGKRFTGLNQLIKGAKKADIKIVVGLAYAVPCPKDKDTACPYDANIAKLRKYLNSTYLELVDLVDNYIPRDLQKNSSFDGWYLAEEVDGITLANTDRSEYGPRTVKQDRAEEWQKYFKNCLEYLNGKRSGNEVLRVYTSAYFGDKPHIKSSEFASFWQKVRSQIPDKIDFTVLLQDERGTGKLCFHELKAYIETLKSGPPQNQCKFGLIVELFDENTACDAPTTMAKLKPQIDMVRDLKQQTGSFIREISSFSASHDIFNARIAGMAREKTELGKAYSRYLGITA